MTYIEPVAWQTDLGGTESVVLATSRSAARWATIRAAREAGYRIGFLWPVTVKRSRYFDGLDARTGQCLDVRTAEEMIMAEMKKRSDRINALVDAALARGAE